MSRLPERDRRKIELLRGILAAALSQGEDASRVADEVFAHSPATTGAIRSGTDWLKFAIELIDATLQAADAQP